MLVDTLKEKASVRGAQTFRDELLWTREVNLTLDANKSGLKTLYDKLRGKSNRLTMLDAFKLMTSKSEILLSED